MRKMRDYVKIGEMKKNETKEDKNKGERQSKLRRINKYGKTMKRSKSFLRENKRDEETTDTENITKEKEICNIEKTESVIVSGNESEQKNVKISESTIKIKNKGKTSRKIYRNKRESDKTLKYKNKDRIHPKKNELNEIKLNEVRKGKEKRENTERKRNKLIHNEKGSITKSSKDYSPYSSEHIVYNKYVKSLKYVSSDDKDISNNVSSIHEDKNIIRNDSYNDEMKEKEKIITECDKHVTVDIKNKNNEIKILKEHNVNDKSAKGSIFSGRDKRNSAEKREFYKGYGEWYNYQNKGKRKRRRCMNHRYMHCRKRTSALKEKEVIKRNRNNNDNNNYVNYIPHNYSIPCDMNMANEEKKKELCAFLFGGLLVIGLAVSNNILGRMRNQVLKKFDTLTASYNVIGYLLLYSLLCIVFCQLKKIDKNDWIFIYPFLNRCRKSKYANNNSAHNLCFQKNVLNDSNANDIELCNAYRKPFQKKSSKYVVFNETEQSEKTQEPLLQQTNRGICNGSIVDSAPYQELDEFGNFIRKGYEVDDKFLKGEKCLNIYIKNYSENESDSSNKTSCRTESLEEEKEEEERNKSKKEIKLTEKMCSKEMKGRTNDYCNVRSLEKIMLRRKGTFFGGWVYVSIISIMDIVSNTLYFVSQLNIPLTVLLLVNQLGFLFSIGLSCVILNKKYNRHHVIAAGIVFAGFLFFYIPYFSTKNISLLTEKLLTAMPTHTSVLFYDMYMFPPFFFYEEIIFTFNSGYNFASSVAQNTRNSSILLCILSVFLTSFSGVMREFFFKKYEKLKGSILVSTGQTNIKRVNDLTEVRENKIKKGMPTKNSNGNNTELKNTHIFFNSTDDLLLNNVNTKRDCLEKGLTMAKIIYKKKNHSLKNHLTRSVNENIWSHYGTTDNYMNSKQIFINKKENGNKVHISKRNEKHTKWMKNVNEKQDEKGTSKKNDHIENFYRQHFPKKKQNIDFYTPIYMSDEENCPQRRYIKEPNKKNKISIVLLSFNVAFIQLFFLPAIICFQLYLKNNKFTIDTNYIWDSFKCFRGYTVDSNSYCEYSLLVYITYLIINVSFNLSVNYFLSKHSAGEFFLLMKSVTPITLIILYFFNFPFISQSDKFYSFNLVVSAAIIFVGVTYFFSYSIDQSPSDQKNKSTNMNQVEAHCGSSLNSYDNDVIEYNDDFDSKLYNEFDKKYGIFKCRKTSTHNFRRKNSMFRDIYRNANRMGNIHWNWFLFHYCTA